MQSRMHKWLVCYYSYHGRRTRRRRHRIISLSLQMGNEKEGRSFQTSYFPPALTAVVTSRGRESNFEASSKHHAARRKEHYGLLNMSFYGVLTEILSGPKCIFSVVMGSFVVDSSLKFHCRDATAGMPAPLS